ncbi:MAG: hypothetical protein KKD74_07790 [Bacteroidetes bacterium]|nr:hypothetical protein [Bacteroidota bacterium]
MNRAYLLSSAGKLIQVGAQTAVEYAEKADQLIAAMNAHMMGRPDIEALVGANNINMMKDNHANHVRFMASIFVNHNPEVLVDTILWVFRAYRSHAFTTNYWAAQLNGWMIILKEKLSKETYEQVYPYYEWMQVNIPVFVKVSDEKLEGLNTMH